ARVPGKARTNAAADRKLPPIRTCSTTAGGRPLNRTIPVTEAQASRLRRYNALMGLLHAGQGVAILLLANDFVLPVTSTFMEGPPGTEVALRHQFDIRIALGVAAFVFISAAAHWLLAGPFFGWY